MSTVRAPVFGRHQLFGTSEHYGKAHGSLLSWWMNYNYTGCCWFPTSSNILIFPSQFWQIRFESYWLHCSKCQILVLLRYMLSVSQFIQLSIMCWVLLGKVLLSGVKKEVFSFQGRSSSILHQMLLSWAGDSFNSQCNNNTADCLHFVASLSYPSFI